MLIKRESWDVRVKRWHRKFALFPKRINDSTVVWLRFYERRATSIWYWGVTYVQWEYREVDTMKLT